MSTNRVRAKIAVDCPIAEAQKRLLAFFDARRVNGGPARVELRVPLEGIVSDPQLALWRDVEVTTRRARDDENLNDLVRIQWKPVDDGPYPTFRGALITWAEHDPQRSYLELDGSYDPPLGVAGAAFDEIVGHEIAKRTAQALLDDIARAMSSPAAR
jgi:hypothetical protein